MSKKYYDAFLKQKYRDAKQKIDIEFRDDDTFYLTCFKDGEAIKIRLDLRILPGEMAKTLEVGKARNEPNMEPYLPPPVGRIQFSYNPFAMMA